LNIGKCLMFPVARWALSVSAVAATTKVGAADPRMALPPFAPEFPGPPRNWLVKWNPVKLLEKTLRRHSLRASQAPHHLDPGDFAAGRHVFEPFSIDDGGRQPAKDIDDDRGINYRAHARRRRSMSS
jgi:hypothetical protein